VKETTKAYMAGLMDAEGCFCITTCKHTTMGHQLYDPSIRCTSTFQPVFNWVVENFGGTVYGHKLSKGNILPRWDWSTDSYKHSQQFLSLIGPYLTQKKAESLVLEQFYALYRQQVPAQRQKLYEELKALKTRESVTTNTLDIEWKNNLVNAYFAGFFDGEGSIDYENNGRSVRIAIGNTAKSLLQFMTQRYGGKLHPFNGRPEHHAPMFSWSIRNKAESEKFLLQVIPYLKIKRDIAQKALNHVRSIKIESELIGDDKSTPVVIQTV
jgi:hypothetical protein